MRGALSPCLNHSPLYTSLPTRSVAPPPHACASPLGAGGKRARRAAYLHALLGEVGFAQGRDLHQQLLAVEGADNAEGGVEVLI